ncbi:beta strand repeat-containing protein [Capnocytophaga sp. ARDL2]|uniref:beta strand repeat-containing protein n=1 Tax=Capnocytophaga sp. ARDL2 TaxID=3238809 RepID=UPI003559144E
MKKRLLPISLIMIGFVSNAQVGIGTLTPNNSAQLDVVAADKGILIPRVALQNITDATTITNGNVNSLLVFNTTNSNLITPGYYYWYVDKWHRIINANDIADLDTDTTNASMIVENGVLKLIDSVGNITQVNISDLNIPTTIVDNGTSFTYTNELGEAVTINLLEGPTGNGIANITVNPSNPSIAIITYTNGTMAELPLPQGPQGIQGIQGPKGDDGEDGVGIASIATVKDPVTGITSATVNYTNGTSATPFPINDGASFLSGSGNPENIDGKNGDSYVDTTTGDVWVKDNGTWTNTGDSLNGRGIESINTVKDPTTGITTVTVNYTDGTSATPFTINDGVGIDTITVDASQNVPGFTTMTVTLSNGNTLPIQVKNGVDGENGKTPTIEIEDIAATANTPKGKKITYKIDGIVVNTYTVYDGVGISAITETKDSDGNSIVKVKTTDGAETEITVNKGDDGVSITNVAVDASQNVPGFTTMTVTLSNGNTLPIQVKNGVDGENGKTPTIEIEDVAATANTPKGKKITYKIDGIVVNTYTVYDGVGISAITETKDSDGNSIVKVKTTDGAETEITVNKGDDGVSITNVAVDASQNVPGFTTMTVTLSNGNTLPIQVKNGVDGENGKTPTIEIEDIAATANTPKGKKITYKIDGIVVNTYTVYDGVGISAITETKDSDGNSIVKVKTTDGAETEITVNKGDDGVSITNVAVDASQNVPGFTTMTVTLSNGNTLPIQVKNGVDGENGKTPTIEIEDVAATANTPKGKKITYKIDGIVVNTYTVYDGKDGRGITSIVQDTTDPAKLTVNYTDNTTSEVTIPGLNWTAANGLNKPDANTVHLGGTLIKPTKITTDATNTIALEGLQPTTEIENDKFVVVDANGVVKTFEPTYSSTEKATGKKWVDGKTVYEKTLTYNHTGGTQIILPADSRPTNIIGFRFIGKTTNKFTSDYSSYNPSTGVMTLGHGVMSVGHPAGEYYIILEYFND